MLRFLGRGAGFSDCHTNAFFVDKNDLIFIDCSMTGFIRIKNIGIENLMGGKSPDKIKVIVTHTHGDHISGIAMLIHYAFFVWNVPIHVIAPSEEVRKDLAFLLDRLEGCDKTAYSLSTVDTDSEDTPILAVIPTDHVEALKGRCFGYFLRVDGDKILYTGDSNSPEPFVSYMDEAKYLYTECSYYKTKVHTYVETLIKMQELFREKDIKVYLMHLDNEDGLAELIRETDFEFVDTV